MTNEAALADHARTTLQQLFIRVCRDSGFRLEATRAAVLAARAAGRHPLEIWMALPSLDVMAQIAAGTHPAARSGPDHNAR